MADKDPAGAQDEPTPDDSADRSGRFDDAAEPTGSESGEPTESEPTSPEPTDAEPTDAELGREPSGDELAAAGADTEGDPDDDEPANGSRQDREPVAVGAAAAGSKAGSKAARNDAEQADAKGKGRATRKRDLKEPAKKRTTPAAFVRESVGELRKVVYPTGQQLANYFVVVLIFVLFVIAYVSLLDLGFGAAMFQVFA